MIILIFLIQVVLKQQKGNGFVLEIDSLINIAILIRLRKSSIKFILATNTTKESKETLLNKLNKMGFNINSNGRILIFQLFSYNFSNQ